MSAKRSMDQRYNYYGYSTPYRETDISSSFPSPLPGGVSIYDQRLQRYVINIPARILAAKSYMRGRGGRGKGGCRAVGEGERSREDCVVGGGRWIEESGSEDDEEGDLVPGTTGDVCWRDEGNDSSKTEERF